MTKLRIERRVWKQARLATHYELTYPNGMQNGEAVVPGDGDIMSPVVIVGEAPGEEEVRMNKPFVGASGNLLRKWLRSAGLSREEVFITNFLKHRPPGNADPTEQEESRARVLMKWELDILEPKIVVTLGRFATSVFYPNPTMRVLSGTARIKKLSSKHGDFDVIVIPVYHPSAALRVSRIREEASQHFLQVRKQLDGLKDNPLLQGRKRRG